MLQHVGLQVLGRAVGLVGEHHMPGQLGSPAVLAPLAGLLGCCKYRVGPTHQGDIFGRGIFGCQAVQVGRVAVVPAHVSVVDRLGVVADAAVVAPAGPVLGQRLWHFKNLGNLGAGVALVEHAQGLVVEVAVHVALAAEKVADPVGSPDRPVVRREHDLGFPAKQVQRLAQILGPGQRVAHIGTAQGLDVVHIVGGVLGGTKGVEIREVKIHLGGRLRPGGQVELDFDPGDGLCLVRLGDFDCGRIQGDRAHALAFAQPGVYLALVVLGQDRPIHVLGAPPHGAARVHVLAHGMLQKPLRRVDLHGAALDGVVRHDAFYAAKMVHMAVGVDDGRHVQVGGLWAILPVQGQGAFGAFDRDQRVNDDQAARAFDDGHVGHVEATHLVQAGAHFKQAVVVIELGLAPQAGVDGVGGGGAGGAGAMPMGLATAGGLGFQIGHQVPDDFAIGIGDGQRIPGGDEALAGIFKGLVVVPFQIAGHLGVTGHGNGRGIFTWFCHACLLVLCDGGTKKLLFKCSPGTPARSTGETENHAAWFGTCGPETGLGLLS